jgi:uncharacterized protein (DUF58 family)
MSGEPNEFGKSDSFFEPKVVRSVMVPTRRLWWLVVAGTPLIVLATLVGMGWMLYAYNLILGAICFLTYRFGASAEGIRIRRRMDAVLSVRARNRVMFEIENESGVAVSGQIRDEVPATFDGEGNEQRFRVNPGNKFHFEYMLVPPERGQEEIRGTFLRLDCPLGLVQKQVELETTQAVKVYPNVLALREFALLNQQGRLREVGVRISKMRGLGTEFESLREYAEGDDYRKVDWSATARRGKLIVRQYEVERNQAVMICVDCGRHMLAEVGGVRKLDLVLDAILMLIQSAIAAGDNVGFLAYGADVITYVPPKKGQRQLGVILNAMYGLVAEPLESDPVRAFGYLAARHKRRSLMVNFTGLEDRDMARDIVQSFGSMARSHLALLVNIADPRFREILRKEPESHEDLFRFASAHFLTDERRQAASMLQSSHLNVLDSEPQDLAKDLVSYYLDVKSKGRL